MPVGEIKGEIVLGVDQASVRKSQSQIKEFARDTGKELDQAKKVKLEANVANATLRLQGIRKLLKNVGDDVAKKKELIISTNKAQSNLTEAKRRLQNFRNTGDESVSRLQRKFDGLGGTVGKLGAIFGTVFAIDKIIDFTKATFNLTAQIESARVAFTTLTGSVETANELLGQIEDFASRTPFNRLKVTEATKKLLGFGFTAKQVIPTLEALGNGVSAVGGGSEELSGIITALGQIQAKGKLSTEEVLQIAERGLPIFDILREKLNLTQKELGNIGNAGITAAEAVPAILEGLQEKFAGSLEEQSKTLSGRLSNVIDQLQTKVSEFGAFFIDDFGSAFDGVGNIIDQFDNTALQAISSAIKSIGDGVFTIVGFFVDVFEAVVGVVKSFSDFFADDTEKTTSIFTGTRRDAFRLISLGLQSSVAFIKGATATIKALFNGAIFGVLQGFDFLKKGASGTANAVSGFFGNVAVNIKNAFLESVNFAIRQINRLVSIANKVLPEVAEIGKLEEFETTGFRSATEGLSKNFVEAGKSLDKLNSGFKKIGDTASNEYGEAIKGLEDTYLGFVEQNAKGNSQIISGSKETALNIADVFEKSYDRTGGASKKSGGVQRKEAEKTRIKEEKELKKIQEARNKFINEQKKAREKLAKEDQKVLDDFAKSVEKRFDVADKEIEKLGDNVEKLGKKIADTQAKIDQATAEGSSNIAERAVEIEELLKNEELSTEKRIALEKELALAKANTTEQDLERANLLATESETEKIIRETEEKKAELQLQLEDLQAKQEAERLLLETAVANRETLERGLTAFLGNQEEARANKAILEYKRIAEARARLLGGAAPNTAQGSTTNNNTTTNGPVSVSVTAQTNATPEAIATAVSNKIISSQKGNAL